MRLRPALTHPFSVCLLACLQVRELLGETGQVLALWMPSIKTHCYAVFESKAQAEETRKVGGWVAGWEGRARLGKAYGGGGAQLGTVLGGV